MVDVRRAVIAGVNFVAAAGLLAGCATQGGVQPAPDGLTTTSAPDASPDAFGTNTTTDATGVSGGVQSSTTASTTTTTAPTTTPAPEVAPPVYNFTDQSVIDALMLLSGRPAPDKAEAKLLDSAAKGEADRLNGAAIGAVWEDEKLYKGNADNNAITLIIHQTPSGSLDKSQALNLYNVMNGALNGATGNASTAKEVAVAYALLASHIALSSDPSLVEFDNPVADVPINVSLAVKGDVTALAIAAYTKAALGRDVVVSDASFQAAKGDTEALALLLAAQIKAEGGVTPDLQTFAKQYGVNPDEFAARFEDLASSLGVGGNRGGFNNPVLAAMAAASQAAPDPDPKAALNRSAALVFAFGNDLAVAPTKGQDEESLGVTGDTRGASFDDNRSLTGDGAFRIVRASEAATEAGRGRA